MKYLLLIYTPPRNMADFTPEAGQKMMAEYNAFTDDLKKSGAFLAGEGLKPIATAKTVRVRGGKSVNTDGPFAETKEQLGGFYMVEVKDLDAALALAAKIPDARNGSVEVRPVMEY